MSNYRKNFGRWGEEIAVRYLVEEGFAILQRNYVAGRGEIDIIAIEDSEIVFIEVKTGNAIRYGSPETRITPAKQRQLYKVARYYIAAHPREERDYRFDAVIIDGSPERHQIRHYRNAFYLW